MKADKKIYTTQDYSIFLQDETNRDVRTNRKLLDSMKSHGFLPEHPLVVVSAEGGKFKVRDGGHRLVVAKELRLPVHYVVSDNAGIEISFINDTQRAWSRNDFVSSYVRQGNKYFIELQKFCEQHDIHPGIAARLLGGDARELKDGTFTGCQFTYALEVLRVSAAAAQHVSWSKCTQFLGAIHMVLKYSSANINTLCDRISSNGGLLKQQAKTTGYIELLASIYNHRTRELLPIRCQIETARRELSATNMGKARAAK
jgi:hypothetical protein